MKEEPEAGSRGSECMRSTDKDISRPASQHKHQEQILKAGHRARVNHQGECQV
jgi:hypothetical protein